MEIFEKYKYLQRVKVTQLNCDGIIVGYGSETNGRKYVICLVPKKLSITSNTRFYLQSTKWYYKKFPTSIIAQYGFFGSFVENIVV